MNKKYCFDLDGTLCETNGLDYENSIPYDDRIKYVNELYLSGNTIIIDTARGSESKKDFYEITKNQLELWGLKFHILRVGTKFSSDFYIDDKAISDKHFFKKKI